MSLPDWAKDPDAVLEKRRKDAMRYQPPAVWWGATVFFAVIVLIVCEVLDAAAWLGGLKAMGWIK